MTGESSTQALVSKESEAQQTTSSAVVDIADDTNGHIEYGNVPIITLKSGKIKQNRFFFLSSANIYVSDCDYSHDWSEGPLQVTSEPTQANSGGKDLEAQQSKMDLQSEKEGTVAQFALVFILQYSMLFFQSLFACWILRILSLPLL